MAEHHAHTRIVNHLTFDGTGRGIIASAGQDGTVCLWDYESGSQPQSMEAHQGRVNAVAFSPSGDLVVTGGGVERGDFSVKVWDARSRSLIRVLSGHRDWPLWVSFSPDGELLASGSYGEICFFDVASWDLSMVLRCPEELRFSTIDFAFASRSNVSVSGGWSHEQERVESRDASGELKGWNVKSKGLVQVWDLGSGRLRHSCAAHDEALTSLAASPTEDLLLTGGRDGAAKVWNLALDEAGD